MEDMIAFLLGSPDIYILHHPKLVTIFRISHKMSLNYVMPCYIITSSGFEGYIHPRYAGFALLALHRIDVIMSAMSSQIIGISIVCSTIRSGED